MLAIIVRPHHGRRKPGSGRNGLAYGDYVLKLAAVLIVSVLTSSTAFSENLDPYAAVLPTSIKMVFIPYTQIPKPYWYAYDQQKFVAVTGVSVSSNAVAAAGESITTLPNGVVCSPYKEGVCDNVGHLYKPDFPQVLISGLVKLDGNNAITWAMDTGFRSEKLTIDPGLSLGFAKRWFLTPERDSQFILETSGWFGQKVSHTPCTDDYNDEYYCANLTHWSNFTWNAHPTSLYVKLWYDRYF